MLAHDQKDFAMASTHVAQLIPLFSNRNSEPEICKNMEVIVRGIFTAPLALTIH